VLHPASTKISLVRDLPVAGPGLRRDRPRAILFVVWSNLIVTAATNGVNLTDGLDGLAAGASIMVFGAYTLMGIWQSNQACGSPREAGSGCYSVRDPLDLALLAAIMSAALVGFLWWNTSPAKIFMGDTGSLAIGGAIAGFAILSRTELLLGIIGGLFVLITLSVIIQVGYFKATGGKRVFKMAPLQHHFELQGLGRSNSGGPVLDPRRAFCGRGTGNFLRRMGGAAVTVSSRLQGSHQLGLRLVRPPRCGDRHRRFRLRGRRHPHRTRRPGGGG
jgi:phospho-N-acetylmuramoyl-pentapeptide-transferase